jgi:hypothetical protein
MLNPDFSDRGDILYGVRWRVMEKYNNPSHYYESLRRYLLLMTKIPEQKYKIDILRFFYHFIKMGESNDSF